MIVLVVAKHPAFPLEFIGYWKIPAAAHKEIRGELTSFFCHYRHKLIFGFNQREEGERENTMSEEQTGFRQGGVSCGNAHERTGGDWSHESWCWDHKWCDCHGNIYQLCVDLRALWKPKEMRRRKGCWGRCTGAAVWQGSITLFLPALDPGAQASDMNLVVPALRLMCLAWLWPVTLLKGSNTPNHRRNKDVYLGENTRHKHGGWAHLRSLFGFSLNGTLHIVSHKA